MAQPFYVTERSYTTPVTDISQDNRHTMHQEVTMPWPERRQHGKKASDNGPQIVQNNILSYARQRQEQENNTEKRVCDAAPRHAAPPRFTIYAAFRAVVVTD